MNMAKKKKKVVHWSKLDRVKLIAMVKRLQSEKTKLQLQLSQARETKLLNESAGQSWNAAITDPQRVVGIGGGAVSEPPHNPSGVELDDMLERRAPHPFVSSPFPWERE